jgi:ATP-dependent protease Clp ATPase subunit
MKKQNTNNEFQVEPCCSFCGKTRKEVKHLLASQLNAVFICNECVVKTSREKEERS